MNDKFTNNTNQEDAELSNRLNAVADQTNVDPRFADELERKLKSAHKPKTIWWTSSTNSILPSLGWVALVVAVGFLLIWSIRNLIPPPQPASNGTPATQELIDTPRPSLEDETNNATPIPESEGYDWRSSKLYLSVPLPQPPADAKLYSLKAEQPATVDTAISLATQFGIQGNAYVTPGRLPGTTAYLVTDGKQRLYVQSDLNYDYYSDYGAYSYMSGDKNISDEQAAAAIDAFMRLHGFEFQYQVDNAQLNPGTYYVLPLTPDGLPVYHDYNIPERLEFTIDENEQVIRVTSYRIDYDLTGTYGIRTAEQAFQQVLDSSTTIQNGVLEIAHSAGRSDAGFWSRTYPDNETITIYGPPTSYPATRSGGTPFVSISQFTATGNIVGIENVDSSTYIEATGQFITGNGVRIFNVDSWKVSNVPETYISGSLRREGDQVILTADDNSGEYVIVDAPPDVPLNTKIPPDDYLAVSGLIIDGNFEWNSIQHYPAGSGGGGGGGGGLGFHQLNLSGTPVPFPSPTALPELGQGTGNYTVKAGDTLGSIASNFGVTVDELMKANDITDPGVIYIDQKLIIPGVQSSQSVVGQRMEGSRGIFSMTTYRKADGSQRVEYGLNLNPNESPFFYVILEGADLQEIQTYHNRPVDIWGTIERVDQNGNPVVKVERYEIPFPDLNFQLLQGKQRMTQIDGLDVALFTAPDGTTYAQLMTFGVPDTTILGLEGSDVILETLAVPGETFGGYPALRVFSGSMAVNPKNDQPTEMTITANQPNVLDEAPPGTENYVPPSAIIEKVELVYYVPDPLYGTLDPNAGAAPQYIQPAWRFYGHYSNGDEFEFLVQALKQEFLLPELAPYRIPG